jgi:hypothetical protein
VADVATEHREDMVSVPFSDIEGSTILRAQLEEQRAQALFAQRVLLREAFGRGGARELGTEADTIPFVLESTVEAN